MDDNVTIATTMNFSATTIIYSTKCIKKHRPHIANFAISIGLLSFQCTHPRVFHDIISNS